MISSDTARNYYAGNNTTNEYAYDFKVFDQDELIAVVRNVNTLVETELTITTDYTVDGVGETAGGSIVLVNSGQAWVDGSGYLDADYEIVIYRGITLTQEVDFANQDDFYPEDHERAMDRIVMMIQKINEELKRCVKVSAIDYTAEMILPAKGDRANAALSFDADGLPTV